MGSEMLGRLLATPGRMVSAGELDAVGAKSGRRATLVRRGVLTREGYGIYRVVDSGVVLPEAPGQSRERHLDRCRVAQLANPGAVISHQSAALIHELVGGSPDKRTILTSPGNHHTKGEGCRIWFSPLEADDVVVVEGLRVTSLLRTAIDVARVESPARGLAVMDSLMRHIVIRQSEGVPLDQLRMLLAEGHLMEPIRASVLTAARVLRGCKGIQKARDAVTLAHPAAESVLESISRFNIYWAGLPMPLIGAPVNGESGKLYWVDALWPKEGVIGEADGALKYSTRDILLAEKHRQDDLHHGNLKIVRWTWTEGVVNPHILITRLRKALAP